MKHTLILLLILLLAGAAFAQNPLGKADRAYNALSYFEAAELYEEAIADESLPAHETVAAQARLGYCYHQMKDPQNTERVLRGLISSYGLDLPEEYYSCYLYYARALANNGKYQQAQEAYGKYASLTEDDRRGAGFSKLYSNVALLIKNAGAYRVDLLDINSGDADFSPSYYKDGLVFVSARNEALKIKRVFSWNDTPFLDLYYLPDLEKIKGKLAASMGGSNATAAVPNRNKRWKSLLGSDAYTSITANDSRTVGFFSGAAYDTSMGYGENPKQPSDLFSKSVNSKYHEGPVAFFKDGNRAIFTRNNFMSGRYQESSRGINKLKLYSADLVNGDWTNITELPANSNEFSSGHPALSPDNTILYFASDRPGGMGGTDLYAARIKGGIMTEPVNLGPEINTKGNEMFPFVDAVGNLYFASDGLLGLGGLDMFFAPMEDYATAKKSINLGAPINSNEDDFGLITDAERTEGYFSSNRKRGGTDDDIYRFRREGPLYACRDLTVTVYDAETTEPLRNAMVQVENKNSSEPMRQMRTDSTGAVMMCLAAENEFVFVASESGYTNNTLGFATSAFDDARPTMLKIPLKKIAETAVAKVPAAATNAKGYVLAKQGAQPLSSVKVKIKDDMNGTTQEVTTDSTGRFAFVATPGHNYSLDVTTDEYGTFGKKIIGYDPARTPDLNLLMFKKGDVVKIDNIYYDLDRANIRPGAANELDKVVEVLKKYPNMKIELGAHTDSRASARYNRTLSNARAKAAQDYLISKGIADKRITAKGYGESKLVNKCADSQNCPEADHQKNRRTEIKILGLN